MSTRRAATLPVSFFRRPADEVARDLVGCVVVSRAGGNVVAARIVETEAYLGLDDPASHAWQGRRTAGNASIYGPPGTWYVYRSYGMHWCANLVCGGPAAGAAVLLRALEPIAGLEVMRARRGNMADRLLASGPGRLTVALAITRALDGQAMRASPVTVHARDAVPMLATTRRVGISRAVEWPLRYAEQGSPWASRARVTAPRARTRG